ncbi:hypothetical protein CIPAW_09G084300 [Carya illinoinensis]|uniref:Uncharacterized protein n=1 Tax=Carya illinoinensis TaxID=32201 RepID=A0A8T1PIM1_CARIL|nr:hypothetical protein CIPAW_09G084300 [Carya illinoinensis]
MGLTIRTQRSPSSRFFGPGSCHTLQNCLAIVSELTMQFVLVGLRQSSSRVRVG